VTNEGKQSFGAPFYFTVASAVILLAGLSGGRLTEAPGFCFVAFLFSLVGILLAKSVAARVVGVLLVGITGGFLAAYLRARYF
jgi:hypothetical protein